MAAKEDTVDMVDKTSGKVEPKKDNELAKKMIVVHANRIPAEQNQIKLPDPDDEGIDFTEAIEREKKAKEEKQKNEIMAAKEDTVDKTSGKTVPKKDNELAKKMAVVYANRLPAEQNQIKLPDPADEGVDFTEAIEREKKAKEERQKNEVK